MSEPTPGPWRFELNRKSRRVQLCGGKPTYDLTVMDFVRWGMDSAAPRFRTDRANLNIMKRAEEFGAVVLGREHHADWFQSIDHPDARLIEAAPDLLAAVRMAVESYQLGVTAFESACWLETAEAALAKVTGS